MVSLRARAADLSNAKVPSVSHKLFSCHLTVSHHALDLYTRAVTNCHRGSRTRGTRVTGMQQPDTWTTSSENLVITCTSCIMGMAQSAVNQWAMWCVRTDWLHVSLKLVSVWIFDINFATQFFLCHATGMTDSCGCWELQQMSRWTFGIGVTILCLQEMEKWEYW